MIELFAIVTIFVTIFFCAFAVGYLVGYDAGDRDNNRGQSTLVPSLRRIFRR